MKRLLKGGRVVDPAHGRDGVFDILIEGDRIARIGANLPAGEGVEVVTVPAGLVITPASHDFGDVGVDVSSAPATFRLTNLLSSPLAVDAGYFFRWGDVDDFITPLTSGTGLPVDSSTTLAGAIDDICVVVSQSDADANSYFTATAPPSLCGRLRGS